MTKKTRRKGFTIVELIIVIAVIGVLAAILIPTFSTVIKKANYADRQSLVKNFNTAVLSETEGMPESVVYTYEQAVEAVKNAGYSEDAVRSSKENLGVVWLGQVGTARINRFALASLNPTTKKVEEILYPQEAITAVAAMPATWMNASNLQSVSAVRKTSIAGCDWTGTERIVLNQDESITSYKMLRGAWSIDLNGHTLNLGGAGDIYVYGGSLTISDSKGTGKVTSAGASIIAYHNGTITVNGGSFSTTHSSYSIFQLGHSSIPMDSASVLTINGGDFTALNPNYNPADPKTTGIVFMFCKDAEVNVFGGTFTTAHGFCISGNGTAGRGGTKINIHAGTFTAMDSNVIYHPQDGELNISGGVIKSVLSSESSTRILDAINVKSGKINISGGIIETQTHSQPALVTPYSNGSENVGSALGIVSNNSYTGNVEVKISGGSFRSAEGYAFSQVLSPGSESKVVSIEITGGTFKGFQNKGLFVTEGTNVSISITNVTAQVDR